MKFNISDPLTGGNKKIEIDEEKFIRPFFDKRMGQEINGEFLGDAYKGYIFRITGGNDKQGFTMNRVSSLTEEPAFSSESRELPTDPVEPESASVSPSVDASPAPIFPSSPSALSRRVTPTLPDAMTSSVPTDSEERDA